MAVNNNFPPLLTTGRMVRLSTDTRPTVGDDGGTLQLGQELLDEDTGVLSFWDGAGWNTVSPTQKLNQIAELLTEIRDSLHRQEQSL